MPNPSMSMNAFFAAVDNPTPARNVYPTSPGATTGGASGGGGVSTMALPSAAGGPGETPAAGNGAMASMGGVIGQPLTWWVTLLILFVVLGFVAKRAGNAGEFSNVKLSAYNILMITLAAAIGIGALKVLTNRFPIPGLSTFIGAI